MSFDHPILITGCARSGTSLTAGVINICGAWGGEMRGATPYNKKGMFENTAIVDGLIKPFLKALGADPLGQDPLPDTENVPIIPEWNIAILRRLEAQGYNGERWFYKGVKMLLIWPVWQAAFPDAKWVIVRRNKNEIAASCMRTPFMRAFNDEAGWLGWVKEHEDRFDQIFAAGILAHEFWPGVALNEPARFKDLISWLGLEWKEDEVNEFIDHSLWNNT